MKSIAYHSVLIVVVFLGIFFGTLPDLFPNALSFFPYFKLLDSGLKELSDFRTSETKTTFLNRNAKGYAAIYRLLRSVDSYTLPPLSETINLPGSIRRGQFIGVESSHWKATTQGIHSKNSIKTVYVCFLTPKGIAEPICELRDLKFLIHDAKVRVFSRLGFFLAFVALLLGEGLFLRNAIKSLLEKRSPQPIDTLDADSAELDNASDPHGKCGTMPSI